MPPSKKRKLASDASVMSDTQTKKNATASEETTAGLQAATEELPSGGKGGSALVDKANERRERFKALQARANKPSKSKDNPSTQFLALLNRKQAIASYKLFKADTAADSEDFERKRAWDWTVKEPKNQNKRIS
ncbi:MAG: hypothetical protein Q9166_006435 [cf. Caloplaca sp. 2 TL-2023]